MSSREEKLAAARLEVQAAMKLTADFPEERDAWMEHEAARPTCFCIDRDPHSERRFLAWLQQRGRISLREEYSQRFIAAACLRLECELDDSDCTERRLRRTFEEMDKKRRRRRA